MCARRCACCLTFFVRVPLSACGSGSPALCGSRLAPSAILLFLWILWPLSLFLSPSPAPLGPGLYILYPHFVSRDREIPIHALRMEGDTCIISLKTGAVNISIHALRVEGDAGRKRNGGADRISIHALRVEGDFHRRLLHSKSAEISIHALRVEGDGIGRVL